MIHASQDDTVAIVEDVSRERPGRVTILHEPNQSFDEMWFRQRLLDAAREIGASHVAVIDGDEILTAPHIPAIRRRILLLPPGGVLFTPIHNLWRSLDRFRCDDSNFGRAWVVLAFRDAPWVTWKPREDGYQFHQRLPMGHWLSPMRYPPERKMGGLMHCQHASWRRLRAKQALYQQIEVLRWPHKDRAEIQALYSRTVDETDARLLNVPPEWWDHGLDRSLIRPDDEPWQEREVNRLIAEHGHAEFADLDLFGVPNTKP